MTWTCYSESMTTHRLIPGLAIAHLHGIVREGDKGTNDNDKVTCPECKKLLAELCR